MPRVKRLKPKDPPIAAALLLAGMQDEINAGAQEARSHGERIAEIERQLADIRIALGGQGIRLT